MGGGLGVGVCTYLVGWHGVEHVSDLSSPRLHTRTQQVKGLVRTYPGSATGARRRVGQRAPQQQQQQQQQQTVSRTSSSSDGGKAASASSGGRRARDKADGGASLSASVGMQVRSRLLASCAWCARSAQQSIIPLTTDRPQPPPRQLEPASYCPPAALLQPPRFNARTGMYEYPTSPPTSSSSSSPQKKKATLPSLSLLPLASRPCAVVAGVLPGSPAEQAGIRWVFGRFDGWIG